MSLSRAAVFSAKIVDAATVVAVVTAVSLLGSTSSSATPDLGPATPTTSLTTDGHNWND